MQITRKPQKKIESTPLEVNSCIFARNGCLVPDSEVVEANSLFALFLQSSGKSPKKELVKNDLLKLSKFDENHPKPT